MDTPKDPTFEACQLPSIVDRAVQSRIIVGLPINMATLVQLAMLLDEAVIEIIQCSEKKLDATEALIQVAVVASHLRRMDMTGHTIGRH